MCYICLLVLLFSPTRESVDISFTSCQLTNCSHLLVSYLDTYPEHRCAFYDLEDDALYRAITQGLLFEDNYESTYSKLQQVSSPGLMHHKFCIFDQDFVFTGSWNPTPRGTYFNDNYILFIKSKAVAKFYERAYTHLLDRDYSFAPLHVQDTDTSMSGYICPLHDCQARVLEQLAQATTSVNILAFTFTDELIAEELLFLSKQGVDVQVIFEKTRITKYSAYHDLLNSTVKIYLDGNLKTMHEKLILVDDEVVLVGSYNPTKGATTINDENLLIVEDQTLAKAALEEFWRVKERATLVGLYK